MPNLITKRVLHAMLCENTSKVLATASSGRHRAVRSLKDYLNDPEATYNVYVGRNAHVELIAEVSTFHFLEKRLTYVQWLQDAFEACAKEHPKEVWIDVMKLFPGWLNGKMIAKKKPYRLMVNGDNPEDFAPLTVKPVRGPEEPKIVTSQDSDLSQDFQAVRFMVDGKPFCILQVNGDEARLGLSAPRAFALPEVGGEYALGDFNCYDVTAYDPDEDKQSRWQYDHGRFKANHEDFTDERSLADFYAIEVDDEPPADRKRGVLYVSADHKRAWCPLTGQLLQIQPYKGY